MHNQKHMWQAAAGALSLAGAAHIHAQRSPRAKLGQLARRRGRQRRQLARGRRGRRRRGGGGGLQVL